MIIEKFNLPKSSGKRAFVETVRKLDKNGNVSSTIEKLQADPIPVPDNFEIIVTNETCLNKNNGQILIQAKETYNIMFNTEFVPAENLGVKNSNWDKKAGYKVTRDCYNSYLYICEDNKLNIIDKFRLYGKETVKYLDGGSCLHLNLDEYPTAEGYKKLLNVAAKVGCNYFCTNVKVTICNECEHICKQTKDACGKCGSKNIDYATRVIGYLKRISNFSSQRQKEHNERYYHRGK